MQFDEISSVAKAKGQLIVFEIDSCVPSHLEPAQMGIAHVVGGEQVYVIIDVLCPVYDFLRRVIGNSNFKVGVTICL